MTLVQKLHYLIASLNNEANDLISNLQITNENFPVAWQLVTCFHNKRLPWCMPRICQMRQVKKGFASSSRQWIVSSHINSLQAVLESPIQDLMLNHLMLATLDSETRMGAHHSFACRHPNRCRIGHKVRGLRVTSKYPVIADSYCHSTTSTSSWKQDQLTIFHCITTDTMFFVQWVTHFKSDLISQIATQTTSQSCLTNESFA